jgi:hypothetical protein
MHFLFFIENTAHIPLILRAISKPNHWLIGEMLILVGEY